MLGQHSDVVDGFGCLPIGDLERGGNGEAHRQIAGGDDEADLTHLASACPKLTAGSTGRRNTGIKSLCRGFKLQGLTWSFIELTAGHRPIFCRLLTDRDEILDLSP